MCVIKDDTRVDLGSDLIQQPTRALPGLAGGAKNRPVSLGIQDSADITNIPKNIPKNIQDDINDQLQNASILVSEGFSEEAKRILHGIIIADPGNLEARGLLEKIHEEELKRMLGGPLERHVPDVSSDPRDVLIRLDRDLELGMFSENGEELGTRQLSIFKDEQALGRFAGKLDKDFEHSSAKELIDLGIAFLEIGLYELAVRQFKQAAERSRPRTDEDFVSAACLTAYCLLRSDRPFEAIASMQPVLQDCEIGTENKVELFYLMGQAYELMKKPDLAMQWYDQVRKVDPRYRDIDERMRLGPNFDEKGVGEK